MTTKHKIDLFVHGCYWATAQSIILNLAGNPRVCTSYDVYYIAVLSKLEILLSLTNKQGSREDQNVNAFKTVNSNKHKFWINKNSDKKKKAKPDSTARNHFVPEDHKYPFKEWKEFSADQQKQVKEVHSKLKNSTQNYTINTTQTPYQTDMVPYNPMQKNSYHPPHQVSTLNSQQYYHPLAPHNLHTYHRSVKSVAIPPIPHGVVSPTSPPRQQFPLDQSIIYAQTRDGRQ